MFGLLTSYTHWRCRDEHETESASILGLLLAFWLLTLSGCERYEQIRVLVQKVDFIGQWSEGSNFFELELDGDVSLEIDGSSESFLVCKGSLRSFEGESVCVGVAERQQGEIKAASIIVESAQKE